MKPYTHVALASLFTVAGRGAETPAKSDQAPPVPRFSVTYMDRSVDPGKDFYHFAAGAWLTNNPVPADKSRWASFSELAERNWYLIHELLDAAAADTASPKHSPRHEVGDFFA